MNWIFMDDFLCGGVIGVFLRWIKWNISGINGVKEKMKLFK